MLSDVEITRTLLEVSDIDSAANRLLELANEAGGHDNISLILARVVREQSRTLS
jgi:protein phosphatase